MYLDIELPKDKSNEAVAKELHALLCAVRGEEARTDGSVGPWPKQPNRDDSWQLDATNDYFFHVDGDGKARLGCRYSPAQDALVQEVARRFMADSPKGTR